MLRRQLDRYGRWLIVIGVLAGAGLISASYILVKQRFPLPWQDRYTINAEFATSAGLNPPGLGQTVNVAGVEVGTIADARLRDGRAIVRLEIDPAKLPHVWRNGTAVLVPNTPLKDMQVHIVPGGPPARTMRDGETIPIAQTTTPIDSDELTAALDADTRDFLSLLLVGFDQGTRGRGGDLNAILKQLEPTTQDLRTLGDALAARRSELRRLIHNLRVLSQAAGAKDRELGELVVTTNLTLETVAREEAPLRASLERLPGTLGALRRSLGSTTTFAHEVKPTLDAIQPTVERLPAILPEVRALLDDAEPIIRDDLRPLVHEVQPMAADLGPTIHRLKQISPDLITTFRILNVVVNQLAYNPPGDDEGALFWLSWFIHNGNSMLSTEDAHGAIIRGALLLDCTTITALEPLLEALLGPLPDC